MTAHWIAALALISTYWFIAPILVLAMYSLTRIVTTDSLFDKQRDWVYARFPYVGFVSKRRPQRGVFVSISNGYYSVNEGTWIGKLLSCDWCTGFWVALFVSGSFLFWPIATSMVLLPLALRVVPGLIAKWVEH